MYPDMGDCDTDLNVDRDSRRQVRAIDIKKGPLRIRHYREHEDAAACQDRGQWVSLVDGFAQFRWQGPWVGKQFAGPAADAGAQALSPLVMWA